MREGASALGHSVRDDPEDTVLCVHGGLVMEGAVLEVEDEPAFDLSTPDRLDELAVGEHLARQG
jgi:hypothetical protein